MTPQARDTFRHLDQELVGRLRALRGAPAIRPSSPDRRKRHQVGDDPRVSRDPVDPQIEDHDATWGIMLSRHCAELTIREASARVSENQVESHHKRALKILRDAGKSGMSKSDFTRRTQFMDHRQRDSVLRTLAEAGLIESMTLQSKGRPTNGSRSYKACAAPCPACFIYFIFSNPPTRYIQI